ncbi:hypothetical protein [Tamlana sp. I1]|uniref:hypothetical protein n=1 Tax=Tamlana sp. I1 TaxID=2762061 RepID=UPI00188FCBD3|nr:hypothetical protein [Tamlana sp. I1]
MNKNLLDTIHCPSDLRLLNQKDLPLFAKELREFIINILATKENLDKMRENQKRE